MLRFRETPLHRLLLALAALVALGCAPHPAAAQNLTYTFPQSVQSTLVTDGVCSGAYQYYLVPNLGQTVHNATVTFTTTGTKQPITANTGFFQQDVSGFKTQVSSSVGAAPFSIHQIISASGYYSQLYVGIYCLPSTTADYTISYSGTSSTPLPIAGVTLQSQVDQLVFQGAPANANISTNVSPPYGTSFGEVQFEFATSGPSGSSISVDCTQIDGSVTSIYTINLSTDSNSQVLPVPSTPCALLSLNYLSGGASANTFLAHYLFYPPGTQPELQFQGVNISTAKTTLVRGGPGLLQNIIVNTSAAGTIKIFDVTGGTCAGTPGTGLKGTVTLAGTESPFAIPYNLSVSEGLCIVTSGTADLTVTYQ